MSSTDPIRPLRPIAGDLWVSRAEHPNRVKRRPQRDQDDEQRGSRQHREDEDETAQAAWGAPIDAGTYDDHGRATNTAQGGEQPASHLDTSA